MMEAPTTPLALAWVAQALRRRGARKCVRPVSGGAIAGEAALATTGGEIAAEIAADDIWLQEWRERIHRWWMLTPYRAQLTDGCLGALALHLFERAFHYRSQYHPHHRSPPPHHPPHRHPYHQSRL